MGATAKKGAVALMRRVNKELTKSVKNYEGALAKWREVRRYMPDYQYYNRTKVRMMKRRETFGALWQHLPKEVQEELGREFWPELSNINEALDGNGLPIRVLLQNRER